METFPSTGRPLQSGFAIAPNSAVARTEFESGPAKQLKTKSKVSVKRQVTYRFSSLSDYNAFWAWFRDNVNYGADWFTWTDPVDGMAKTARIVEKLGNASPQVPDLGVWHVDMVIEAWST